MDITPTIMLTDSCVTILNYVSIQIMNCLYKLNLYNDYVHTYDTKL